MTVHFARAADVSLRLGAAAAEASGEEAHGRGPTTTLPENVCHPREGYGRGRAW